MQQTINQSRKGKYTHTCIIKAYDNKKNSITMIHIELHKLKAIAIYIGVVSFEWFSGGQENGIAAAVVLGFLLLLILFSGVFAFLGSFGFMESFASDHRDGLSSSSVSFLSWILFLIGCAFFIFNWAVY